MNNWVNDGAFTQEGKTGGGMSVCEGVKSSAADIFLRCVLDI